MLGSADSCVNLSFSVNHYIEGSVVFNGTEGNGGLKWVSQIPPPRPVTLHMLKGGR